MRRLVFLLIFFASATVPLAAADGRIRGVVSDPSGAVVPGASVELRTSSGALIQDTRTDAVGTYLFDGLSAGTFVIEVSLPNFSRLRRSGLQIAEGATTVVNVTLSLSLSADVTVTGKRSFDIAELADNESLVGVALSATQGVVSARQIDNRPIMRAGEVLEAVPGLIISQHSGEGKANQYYLRGFNLDHGTDFATSVAGVPVNMPTHAHGHGYSDLNFLIPELIAGVQFNKGPYAAEEGDFSTAGASHIRYVNELDKPLGTSERRRGRVATRVCRSVAAPGRRPPARRVRSRSQRRTVGAARRFLEGEWRRAVQPRQLSQRVLADRHRVFGGLAGHRSDSRTRG